MRKYTVADLKHLSIQWGYSDFFELLRDITGTGGEYTDVSRDSIDGREYDRSVRSVLEDVLEIKRRPSNEFVILCTSIEAIESTEGDAAQLDSLVCAGCDSTYMANILPLYAIPRLVAIGVLGDSRADYLITTDGDFKYPRAKALWLRYPDLEALKSIVEISRTYMGLDSLYVYSDSATFLGKQAGKSVTGVLVDYLTEWSSDQVPFEESNQDYLILNMDYSSIAANEDDAGGTLGDLILSSTQGKETRKGALLPLELVPYLVALGLLYKDTPNEILPAATIAAATINPKQELTTMQNLKTTLRTTVTANANGATKALEITVGKAGNKVVTAMLKPHLPIGTKKLADNFIGALVAANLTSFAVQQFMPNNKKAVVVANAMLTAAFLQAADDFDIEGILQEVMDKISGGKVDQLLNSVNVSEELE